MVISIAHVPCTRGQYTWSLQCGRAGLGMQSVHRTATHAVAYAACSGKCMALTCLCGRDAELTVYVLCTTVLNNRTDLPAFAGFFPIEL